MTLEDGGLLVGGGGGLAQLLLPLPALGGGGQQGAGHQRGPEGELVIQDHSYFTT